jgi:hypothetical protein
MDVLEHFFKSDYWQNTWEELELEIVTFENLGLDRRSPDSLVWRTCQDQQIVLVTANRNQEGSDSLEATIRAFNKINSLPVFTLANPDRILVDRDYADLVAERMLDRLIEIDKFLGAGRIWLP